MVVDGRWAVNCRECGSRGRSGRPARLPPLGAVWLACGTKRCQDGLCFRADQLHRFRRRAHKDTLLVNDVVTTSYLLPECRPAALDHSGLPSQ
jgi:hypothetical protein